MYNGIERLVFDEYVENGAPLHIETICRKLNFTENALRVNIPNSWFIGHRLVAPDHVAIAYEISLLRRDLALERLMNKHGTINHRDVISEKSHHGDFIT